MSLLNGKIGFVTGAGHGQGRAHAVRMAEEGADLVLCDICAPIAEILNPMATLHELEETAQLVEKAGRRVVFGVADVRDLARVQTVVDEGIAAFGRIDVAVANAGVWRAGAFLNISPDEYDAIMDTNVRGVWNTCRAVVPSMIRAGGGSIVITSSAAGLRGHTLYAHYVASKHAVVGLMRALANELAEHRIRVNTVHPGAVNSFISQQPEGTFEELIRDRLFRMGAMNVLPVGALEPEDLSNAVVWLLSEQAKWVTGVTLPVDAGATNKP